jgi:hypothetical protein
VLQMQACCVYLSMFRFLGRIVHAREMVPWRGGEAGSGKWLRKWCERETVERTRCQWIRVDCNKGEKVN